MQFIDEAVIHVKAGDGGNGSAAMRREDGVPHGGPSGGDGGNGGSIIFVADPQLSSLLDFKYRRHYLAERGEDGRNKDQYGAKAPDLVLRVPVGTVVILHDANAPRAARKGKRVGPEASDEAGLDADAAEAEGEDAEFLEDADAEDDADAAGADAEGAAHAEGDAHAEGVAHAAGAVDAEGHADANTEGEDEGEDEDAEAESAGAAHAEAAEAEHAERTAAAEREALAAAEERVSSEVVLADLSEAGQRFVVAKGGVGGKGNIHFKTPWNQAPRQAEPGTPGEDREVRLELKLLADVGLLGFPNVGKSTFISRASRARPKIADYPFTTLSPNLGVVKLSDERNFVIADIPGLIEGASDGAGLGHQFLRHVERCRVLLHILDATYTTGPGRTPMGDFDIINRELRRYAPGLADKPQIVVLNKIDATASEDVDVYRRMFSERGVDLLTISAATGAGVPAVLEQLWSHLHPSPKGASGRRQKQGT